MRILVANPFGIGDVLFSLPLAHAIREAYPEGFLGYLCNRRTQELVGSVPFLDWHIVFEKDEFRAIWRRSRRQGMRHLWDFLEAVERQRFDTIVDLSLGWQYGLAAAAVGIRKRVGFDFHGRGWFLTHRLALNGFHDRPVSEYELDLLPLLGLSKPDSIRFCLPIPEAVESQARGILEEQGISSGDRLIGIVPGGGASWGPQAVFKQWAPEYFAQVADQAAAASGARILLLGNAQEAPLCERVASLMKSPALRTTCDGSLLLLAGILKRCLLVIGNDSGPMHLAAWIGTRTVSIFGPVDGSVYGPAFNAPNGVAHRVVSKALACRPCYQGFRFPPCPWDNACLKQLETTQVMGTVQDLLEDAIHAAH